MPTLLRRGGAKPGSAYQEGAVGPSGTGRAANLRAFSPRVPSPRSGTSQRQAPLWRLLFRRHDSDSAPSCDFRQAPQILEPRQYALPRTRSPQAFQPWPALPDVLWGNSRVGAARTDLSAWSGSESCCAGVPCGSGATRPGRIARRREQDNDCAAKAKACGPARTLRLIRAATFYQRLPPATAGLASVTASRRSRPLEVHRLLRGCWGLRRSCS